MEKFNKMSELSTRVTENLTESLTTGEEILAMMQTNSKDEVIVATTQRVLIIKTGIATTGSISGAKVNAWPYRSIQSVEIGTSLMACRIEIKHPGLVQQAGSYSHQIQADHIVMFGKHRLEELRELAKLIEEQMAMASNSAVEPQAIDPLDRLRKLAELKELGAVTEEEFAAAKAAILGELIVG